jgi:hypothetical protein
MCILSTSYLYFIRRNKRRHLVGGLLVRKPFVWIFVAKILVANFILDLSRERSLSNSWLNNWFIVHYVTLPSSKFSEIITITIIEIMIMIMNIVVILIMSYSSTSGFFKSILALVPRIFDWMWCKQYTLSCSEKCVNILVNISGKVFYTQNFFYFSQYEQMYKVRKGLYRPIRNNI